MLRTQSSIGIVGVMGSECIVHQGGVIDRHWIQTTQFFGSSAMIMYEARKLRARKLLGLLQSTKIQGPNLSLSCLRTPKTGQTANCSMMSADMIFFRNVEGMPSTSRSPNSGIKRSLG